MSEVFGFTEPERQRFLEMWKWYKTQSPRRPIQGVEPDDYPAPDVYVAKVPNGGIRGLLLANGTTREFDEPGEALCNIYRLIEDTSGYTGTGPGEPELRLIGTEKRVYNLSTTQVTTTDPYILIVRSKQGVWYATKGIGTSGFSGSFTFCTGGIPATRTAVVVNGLITSIA